MDKLSSKVTISDITTYQSGIAQAAANRKLNRIKTEYLSTYDLTPMQWFMIGHIYDQGETGCRLSDLAEYFDTTLPYVTSTITLLESKGIVRKSLHLDDSRVKVVSIAHRYRKTVQKIEREMRNLLRETLFAENNITRSELDTYVQVLYKIIS